MSLRKFYIGTVGPFLYDDSGVYADGSPVVAFRLLDDADNTVFKIVGPPSADEDAVRMVDSYIHWVSPPISETSSGVSHDFAEDGNHLYIYSSVTSKWMKFAKVPWGLSGQLMGLGLFTYP